MIREVNNLNTINLDKNNINFILGKAGSGRTSKLLDIVDKNTLYIYNYGNYDIKDMLIERGLKKFAKMDKVSTEYLINYIKNNFDLSSIDKIIIDGYINVFADAGNDFRELYYFCKENDIILIASNQIVKTEFKSYNMQTIKNAKNIADISNFSIIYDCK